MRSVATALPKGSPMLRNRIHRQIAFVVGAALLVGCTSIVVKKDPHPLDHGFRFYRPKPYLFIGPVGSGGQKSGSSGDDSAGDVDKGGAKEKEKSPAPKEASGTTKKAAPSGSLTDNNFLKVGIELKYLPDFSEEYSVRLRPGIGLGTLSFKLDDGWNLTSVNMSTDQKLPELLTSIATLVGSLKPGAGVAGGSGGGAGGGKKGAGLSEDNLHVIVDSRPDVPLGFYEAIVACGPGGQKHLFGWRYVGFMPFSGCAVQVCDPPKTVSCDPSELWGLVATPNSIKFDRLTNIEAGPGQKWPYHYKVVPKPAAGKNGEDAPPPDFQPLKGLEPEPPAKVIDPAADILLMFKTFASASGNPVKVADLALDEDVKAFITDKSVTLQEYALKQPPDGRELSVIAALKADGDVQVILYPSNGTTMMEMRMMQRYKKVKALLKP